MMTMTRQRAVSVENIPKEELDASSSSQQQRMKVTTTTSSPPPPSSIIRTTSTTTKPVVTTTATVGASKKEKGQQRRNNNKQLPLRLRSTIFKHCVDSKVGLKFLQVQGKVSEGGYGVYIDAVHPNCLAHKQTKLIPGLRVYTVNGLDIESSQQAAILIRTCEGEIDIVTQNYMTLEATTKKKRNRFLGLGCPGISVVAAYGGIQVSKVTPKGLFPKLKVGQRILSINGTYGIKNAEIANKLLKSSTTIQLQVVVVVDADRHLHLTDVTSSSSTLPVDEEEMEEDVYHFSSSKYGVVRQQNFDVDDDNSNNNNVDSELYVGGRSSSGGLLVQDDVSSSAERGTSSSTDSTALMSTTVRSYSISGELGLMDKVSGQMMDDFADFEQDHIHEETTTEDDTTSVISEMTNEEVVQVLQVVAGDSSIDTEDLQQEQQQGQLPVPEEEQEEEQEPKQDPIVIKTSPTATTTTTEPSEFSCLDENMEDMLPSGTTHVPQLDMNTCVVAEALRTSTEEKAGIRLRRSDSLDSILICGLLDDGLFVKSSLQVGMKIVTINGVPCPKTTGLTVAAIKNSPVNSKLVIEAANIDWDATLSDAWAKQ